MIGSSVGYRSHQLFHRTIEAHDASFWNLNMPVPICLDARAAHSYFLHIAKWTLMAVAGCTKAQMTETITTAIDNRQLPAIESEPVRSRMSKLGYPDDSYEHWLPHLRFFIRKLAQQTEGSESAWFSAPRRERCLGAPGCIRDCCATVVRRNGISRRLRRASSLLPRHSPDPRAQLPAAIRTHP